MPHFPSIRIEGGLLGPDILDEALAGELPGQRAADFGIDGRRSLTDEIVAAFADARTMWGVFQNRLQRLPEDDLATTVTRDTWAVPLLGLLGYAPTYNPRAHEVDGQTFAVSHRAAEAEDAPPVHIVGARQELGRVPPSGRPRLAPHSLVQEYLNRTEHVWGLVTNGRTLRLLRDSTLVRRQAYIEFDLAAMLEEQLFQDFAAMYRLVHRTRLPRGLGDGDECLLEKYHQHSVEQGGRVREHLREGVEKCIELLANGFLGHAANGSLRERVSLSLDAAHRISPESLYRQLLGLVYRFLFLLVSEDRGLLSNSALYRDHYSISRLRRLLDFRAAWTDHDDLWQSLRVLWYVLRSDAPQTTLGGKPLASTLGLEVLNGQLFDSLELDDCTISNKHLLEAFWHLAYYDEQPERRRGRVRRTGGVTRRVNYAALDVEELGSVYESLLEYHPAVEAGNPPRFALVLGSERKTTGSYYTPPELVGELIKSALEPVLADRLDAVRKAKPKATAADLEKAILAIRVCDPACGSGHFLLAAARRLGRELAKVRSGEDEPAPERVREAVRDVVSHCIYGVDKNPLAVDLCRVALWLESHAEAKPLTFLDHRIRCGDSLIGVFNLDVLSQGIPDKAFEPLEGDDKAAARAAMRRNREERDRASLYQMNAMESLRRLGGHARQVDAIEDDSPELIRRKRDAFSVTRASPVAVSLRLLCNLWTAAFFQPLVSAGASPPITTGAIHDLAAGGGRSGNVTKQTIGMAEGLAARERFFHWPLEFPDVFEEGGFDCLLSNPPWERVKLQEQEFFAARDNRIATAPNKAARSALIRLLPQENPALHEEFTAAVRGAEGASLFLRHSGRYPLCGRGDINTYAVFAEQSRNMTAIRGACGIIVPSGIATDDTTKHFFQALLDTGSLLSLYDFENRRGLFPEVDGRMKFCLLTTTGRERGRSVPSVFVFYAHHVKDLGRDDRRLYLTADDIALLNPNSRTCPLLRSRRDVEIARRAYQHVPVLLRETPPSDPWAISITTVFHMTNDAALFRSRDDLTSRGFQLRANIFTNGTDRWLPVLEGKMIDMYDHRSASIRLNPNNQLRPQQAELTTADQHTDPSFVNTPYLWCPESEVVARLPRHWEHKWFPVFKRVTAATNERTVVGGIVPAHALSYTLYAVTSAAPDHLGVVCLMANMLSYAADYFVRQKTAQPSLPIGVMYESPFLPPACFDARAPWARDQQLRAWIVARVLELTYTSWDLRSFAADCGFVGEPFGWDEGRRAAIRCELDAAFFHLYGLARADVEFVMDSFTTVRRRDEELYGEYRTKAMILEQYDRMGGASAMQDVGGGDSVQLSQTRRTASDIDGRAVP